MILYKKCACVFFRWNDSRSLTLQGILSGWGKEILVRAIRGQRLTLTVARSSGVVICHQTDQRIPQFQRFSSGSIAVLTDFPFRGFPGHRGSTMWLRRRIRNCHGSFAAPQFCWFYYWPILSTIWTDTLLQVSALSEFSLSFKLTIFRLYQIIICICLLLYLEFRTRVS